jgi:hypothetical protein
MVWRDRRDPKTGVNEQRDQETASVGEGRLIPVWNGGITVVYWGSR